jgi:hypothetical protein
MNNYIFAARFQNTNGEEDFLYFEMNTPNQKNVLQYIPYGATNIRIFQFDFRPSDFMADVREAA